MLLFITTFLISINCNWIINIINIIGNNEKIYLLVVVGGMGLTGALLGIFFTFTELGKKISGYE